MGSPQKADHTLIPDLEYAGDMCLLSNSMDEFEEILLYIDLDLSFNQMGLSIISQKTTILGIILTIATNNNFQEVSLYKAQMIEPVDRFCGGVLVLRRFCRIILSIRHAERLVQ